MNKLVSFLIPAVIALSSVAFAQPNGHIPNHPSVGYGGVRKPELAPLPKPLNWAWAPHHFEAFCETEKGKYELDLEDSFFTAASCELPYNGITVSAIWGTRMGVEGWMVEKTFPSEDDAKIQTYLMSRQLLERSDWDDARMEVGVSNNTMFVIYSQYSFDNHIEFRNREVK